MPCGSMLLQDTVSRQGFSKVMDRSRAGVASAMQKVIKVNYHIATTMVTILPGVWRLSNTERAALWSTLREAASSSAAADSSATKG